MEFFVIFLVIQRGYVVIVPGRVWLRAKDDFVKIATKMKTLYALVILPLSQKKDMLKVFSGDLSVFPAESFEYRIFQIAL